MIIINIEPSNRKNKRFKITLSDGRIFHFGLKNGSTYIDHHDKDIREAYWARHFSNPLEHKLISNLIPSPALFSSFLLWGDNDTIDENIDALNALLP
jgi:hypothetical protein